MVFMSACAGMPDETIPPEKTGSVLTLYSGGNLAKPYTRPAFSGKYIESENEYERQGYECVYRFMKQA